MHGNDALRRGPGPHLTNSKEKISQSSIIDIELSDHMTYCTRNVPNENTNKKTYVKSTSFKQYTKEICVDKLSNSQEIANQ